MKKTVFELLEETVQKVYDFNQDEELQAVLTDIRSIMDACVYDCAYIVAGYMATKYGDIDTAPQEVLDIYSEYYTMDTEDGIYLKD